MQFSGRFECWTSILGDFKSIVLFIFCAHGLFLNVKRLQETCLCHKIEDDSTLECANRRVFNSMNKNHQNINVKTIDVANTNYQFTQ